MDLREYLFRKRMTKADFARKIGASAVYVREIERGERQPGKFLAQAIELATDGVVTVEDLRLPQKEESKI